MSTKKTWIQPEISFVDLLATEDPIKTMISVAEDAMYIS